MPSETGRPVPYLDEVALTFPDLVIVGGHIGHPWTDEMIGLAWKHDNVYIDTSAYLPRYYPPQLVQFMTTYGKHKVMFGSNFPQLQFDRCMTQVENMKLADDVKALFLRENAVRVFKL
jgi:predicted TIM-barrel fold metal-dependent hydrolase